ncbi:MAG: hemerythrin domain-containing protein [Polyangiaceae bacterium]
MYRHPALAPLSREHHRVLQLARGIQKNASAHLRATLPAEPRALAAHVATMFASELEGHFEIEERILVEAVRGRDAELDTLCTTLVREHTEMRVLAGRLVVPELSSDACQELLDRLGAALEEHVRQEERTFYERIQTIMSEAELLRLGESLERGEK